MKETARRSNANNSVYDMVETMQKASCGKHGFTYRYWDSKEIERSDSRLGLLIVYYSSVQVQLALKSMEISKAGAERATGVRLERADPCNAFAAQPVQIHMQYIHGTTKATDKVYYPRTITHNKDPPTSGRILRVFQLQISLNSPFVYICAVQSTFQPPIPLFD